MSIVKENSAIVNIAPLNTDELLRIPLGGTDICLYADNVVRNELGILDIEKTTAFLWIGELTKIKLSWWYFVTTIGAVDAQGFFLSADCDLTIPEEPSILSLDWARLNDTVCNWLQCTYLVDNQADKDFAALFHQYRLALVAQNLLALGQAHLRLFPGSSFTNNGLGIPEIKTKKIADGVVYLIGNKSAGILKIGYSTNVDQRLKTLQRGCAFELGIIKTKKGTLTDEQQLLERFKKHRLKGEWFKWCDHIVSQF